MSALDDRTLSTFREAFYDFDVYHGSPLVEIRRQFDEDQSTMRQSAAVPHVRADAAHKRGPRLRPVIATSGEPRG